MRVRPLVVPLVAVAVVALSGCSSGPSTSGASYGPAGHRFSIAFPKAATSESDLGSLTGGLPAGSKAYGYQVSAAPDIFSSSAPVPDPPSYGVAMVVAGSSSFAAILDNGLVKSLKAKKVTVNGIPAEEVVGTESSFPDQVRSSHPTAGEGILVVRRGTTVYVILAVTDNPASARTFLSSFRTA